MLDIRTKPVERIVFRSDLVAFGSFRCPATHPLFRDSGPSTHHTFVFPRTATMIRHAGAPEFTATPHYATLFNEGQEYTRKAVSAEDASDWFVIAYDILGSALGDTQRPFRRKYVPVDAATFVEQRKIFESAASLDPHEVDERVLGIFARIAPDASRQTTCTRDSIEHVKTMIAEAPAENIPLRRLAAAAGTSPFHLCRAFRRETGQTITAYKHSLRLRLALGMLRSSDGDIADVAFQLGYASHSHFTAAFRRHFHMTPSQYLTARI